jgi:hypothetical protein
MLAVIPHRGCLWLACKNSDVYTSRRNEGYKNVMGQSMLHSFRAACPPALPWFCLGLDGFFFSVQAPFWKSHLADSPEVLPQARYQADTVRTHLTCGVYDARHLVVLTVWIGFPHALHFVMSVARPLHYLWHCLTC